MLFRSQKPILQSHPILPLLPSLNAGLNFLSAFCLILGVSAIKKGLQDTHKRYMLSAFAASTLFLIGYLIYHTFHGDTLFTGQGFIRPIYFFILISHIILTIAALPMILTTFFLALIQNFEFHKKLARWTFPIWLYISVTGVLIYFMLRIYN